MSNIKIRIQNRWLNTPTRRLNNADLPTFGLPTMVTLGRRWSGICRWNFKWVITHKWMWMQDSLNPLQKLKRHKIALPMDNQFNFTKKKCYFKRVITHKHICMQAFFNPLQKLKRPKFALPIDNQFNFVKKKNAIN